LKDLAKTYNFISDAPDYRPLKKQKLNPLIKKANEHKKTNSGKIYDAAVSDLVGPYVQKIVQTCHKNLDKIEKFDVVFIINKLGIAEKIHWSYNKTAQCFIRSGVLNWIFPKNWKNDFHFHIEIRIQ
jgi:hypothetical protein